MQNKQMGKRCKAGPGLNWKTSLPAMLLGSQLLTLLLGCVRAEALLAAALLAEVRGMWFYLDATSWALFAYSTFTCACMQTCRDKR